MNFDHIKSCDFKKSGAESSIATCFICKSIVLDGSNNVETQLVQDQICACGESIFHENCLAERFRGGAIICSRCGSPLRLTAQRQMRFSSSALSAFLKALCR